MKSYTTEFKVENRYLILPVRHGDVSGKMSLSLNGQLLHRFDIELGDNSESDYNTFVDLSRYDQQVLHIEYQGKTDLIGLYLSDEIPGQTELYTELLRPQFHFSSRRGWVNDPNGLVFFEGVYHQFFQHNPYGTEWGNMHWGHAVSTDLMHWEEKPIVLYPDSLGSMYTGCAVVDHHNTSGLGNNGEPPLILIYTAAGSHAEPVTEYTQCIAYSTDKGENWMKLKSNPVLPHVAGNNRDPKVIWHSKTSKWVMVLYLEKNDYAIFISQNLLEWERTCNLTLPNCTEVPDFFPLSVDDNIDDVRWVFWGANTTYYVGDFNGRDFIPDGKYKKLQPAGVHYAAQTYSNIPDSDGRRIMVGWMRQNLPGMPFGQFLSVPHTLSLRKENDDIVLCTQPVEELSELRTETGEIVDISLNENCPKYSEVRGELLDVSLTLEFGNAKIGGLMVRGISVWYDRRTGGIFNGSYSAQIQPDMDILKLRVIVDRASVEVFADDGRVMMAGGCIIVPSEIETKIFVAEGDAVIKYARVSLLRPSMINKS